ncbi:peptidase E [Gelidibacter sp. F2691]|nr:peptidase E [Gelidibacter sp. F2691]
MKTIKILVLALILPVLISMSVHKFYVSVTEVEYVPEKKSVQIISRIFIDDLENTLRKRFEKRLTFSPKNEAEEVEVYLQRYLKDKITITINGKPVDFKYIGKEYDNDILFCYLEVTGIKDIKAFEISNSLLFDSFDDQQNIVKLNINDEKKSYILMQQNNKAMLKF